MKQAPIVLTAEQQKEMVQVLLCLGLMIAGPAILFEWRHRIEQEHERSLHGIASSPDRVS